MTPASAVSESVIPLWQACECLDPPPCAPARDWLLEPGSLTRRLTAASGGRFAVEPLHEGWAILRDDECQALGVPAGSEGWVREVYLLGAGTRWVFARSVAARQALQHSGFALESLGQRALGHLLFSDPAFTRQALTLCRYPQALLPQDCQHPALWARRSLFCRAALGILVAEVFLPDFWTACKAC